MILVNLKTYDCDPVAVGRAVASVADETDIRVAVAPPATHLAEVAATGAETWGQHVDPIEHGSSTGGILAEHLADAGATGTLLNHSEQRLRLDRIDGAIEAADRAGLGTLVCANDPEQVAAAVALGPDRVAVEPPELIGSGTPVSRADPEVVEAAVAAGEAVDPSVPILCGAGIGSGEDVLAADRLGASGVLLASGVATAPDPREALWALVEPLR